MSREVSGKDRFRPVAAYVYGTHVILALGALGAPVVALRSAGPIAVLAGLAAAASSIGAAALVANHLLPFHPWAKWLNNTRCRIVVDITVLLSAWVAMAAVLDLDQSYRIPTAITLAWALRAVSCGPFSLGIVRLLVATLASSLVMAVAANSMDLPGVQFPLLVMAAVIALGVLGQDTIYILATELKELKARDTERALTLERNRFAGELHDIQGQHLGLIAVEAELVSKLTDRGDHFAAKQHAERIQIITGEALDEMYRVIHATRDIGFDEEIANAAKVLQAAGIVACRDIMRFPEISDEADRLLGLTVREAITNIIKHTRASSCSITAYKESRMGREGVTLIVVDPGPSIASHPKTVSQLSDAHSGTGLKTLKKRYRELGGEFEFNAGHGSRLRGWLPV